jgi:succinate dehydrogenase/fumarate reductase-like Fe-S protein
MRFRIYRYDPESGAAPRMQDYELDFDPKGKKVLDALIAIKDSLDESLSFRRSCREGVCGSDGVNVNGTNVLACITALEGLKEPITIRPLPRLGVIRDLIVGHGPVLPALQGGEALSHQPGPGAGERAPAEPGGAGRAGRPVGVHPVWLLYHVVSVLLVEPGQVPRAGGVAPGLSFHR